MNIKYFLSILLPMIIISCVARAYTGKVTYTQGEVTQTSQGKAGKAMIGSSVAAGDNFKTGLQSLAILTMEDGAVFKLNEKSDLSVPASEEGALSLSSGSVFSKIPKQKLNHQFKIRTPTAVMGVRGTQFFTSFGQEKETSADVWMCVNEGSVEVTSLANQKKVLVRQGEGVLVPSGKDVTPPKKYEWTKNLNWNVDPGAGNLINKSVIKYEGSLLKEEYD
jgi:ferric-dicitrate binding protein FerR (iron transport regulator)